MKIEWIPVSERLPEKSGKVFVFTDSLIAGAHIGNVHFVHYSNRHKAFNADDGRDDTPWAFENVVFWAEAPEPPEGWFMYL